MLVLEDSIVKLREMLRLAAVPPYGAGAFPTGLEHDERDDHGKPS